MASVVSISTLAYLFSRMNDTAADNTVGVTMSIMMLVFVPLSIISIKILYYDLQKGRYLDRNKKSSAFYPIIYIFLFLTSFILSFSSAPLIQYRFFAMAYIFIPFILPYALYVTNKLTPYYLVTISVIFILRFIAAHNLGAFKYAEFSDIMLYSLFDFSWKQ